MRRLFFLLVGSIIVSVLHLQVPAQQKPDKKPRLDAFGDPLPPGAVARLGTVRWRPGLAVGALVYSPDGKIVASGGGKYVGVTFWDAATGRPLHHLEKPTSSSAVAFSPDSKLVAHTGDEFIRLYDVATAKEVRKFDGKGIFFFYSVAFCSDGKTVAAGGEDAAEKPLIVLWDAIADKELFRLQGDQRTMESVVAFSPDGKLLASGSADDAVRLWDVATGKLIRQFKGHTDGVNELAFSPSGKVLASAAQHGVGRFWDVQTGNLIHQFKPADGKVLSLAYSPDGKLLVTSGRSDAGVLRLWDTETGKEIRHWTANNHNIRSAAFSPDGRVIVSAGIWDNAIQHWDPATGREIEALYGHTGVVYGPLLFSPDGKTMLSCGLDRRVMQWDIASGKQIRQVVSGPLSPQENTWPYSPTGLSTDGKLLARVVRESKVEGGEPNDQIRIWNLETLKEQVVLEGRAGHALEIKFSPAGRFLASHGNEGVRIWDISTAKQRFHFPEIGYSNFSADGKLIAVVGRNDQTIRLMEVATGKEVRRWNRPGDVWRLMFSSDGSMLASAGGEDDPLCVWAVATGKELMRFDGHQYVRALDFSPSGRVLAAKLQGGKIRDAAGVSTIYLCDAWTGEEIRQIETPHGWLTSLAFAPDGRLLASGGDESAIMLWDMTGQLETGQAKPAALSAKQLADLWSDLIGTAAKADKAIWRLALAPSASLSFLKTRMQPDAPADEKLVSKLVAALESERYADRQKAFQDLEKLGESAEGSVRKHLETKITLEARQRLQQFLDNRGKEVIRKLRAIETLEHIGTAEARQVLQALAKDSPSPRVVEFATSTLVRLAKRGN